MKAFTEKRQHATNTIAGYVSEQPVAKAAGAPEDAGRLVATLLDALQTALGGLCSAALQDGTKEMVSAAIESAERYQSLNASRPCVSNKPLALDDASAREWSLASQLAVKDTENARLKREVADLRVQLAAAHEGGKQTHSALNHPAAQPSALANDAADNLNPAAASRPAAKEIGHNVSI